MRAVLKRIFRLPITRCRRAGNYAAASGRSVSRAITDGLRATLRDTVRIIAASAIVFTFGAIFTYLLRRSVFAWPDLAAFSIFCGATITIVLSAFGRSEMERFHSFLTGLDSPCRPDNDPYISKVILQGRSNFERANFVGEFLSIPASTPSALLVLKQTGKSLWQNQPPYTVESMYAQLVARRSDERAKNIKIDWVCFVTKHFTFVAYQPFDAFEEDIMMNKNSEYATILCEPDPVKFRSRIDERIAAYKKQRTERVAQQNVIPRLKKGNLPDNLTKKMVMYMFAKTGEDEAMLTSDEKKPLGMVTLSHLNKVTTANMLFSAREKKLLERHIKTWTAQSEGAAAAIEAVDIPSPPANTVDDSPELRAMIPDTPLRDPPSG